MLATDKQIKYLVYLANKVERMKKDHPEMDTPYIDWNKERRKGVTTEDASIRIQAYKEICRWGNFIRVLCCQKQI